MGIEKLDKIKIGVLGGGVSAEKDISFISAKEVYRALQRNNLDVVFIDILTSRKEKVKETVDFYGIDLAFIALHGEFGEDGGIQEILEELDIPYTGSQSASSLRAMDKALTKKIFAGTNILTPDFIIYTDKKSFSENIKYPVVIKPHFSGSSIGVSIVRSKSDLKQAFDTAFSCQSKVICEDYIEGKELTVGILEEEPLAVVEIIPKKGYFDFDAKYGKEKSEFVAPARLKDSVYKSIQEISLAAHKALGCRHFSRVDIRLDKNNIPYVLEVNSIPGLTSHSLFPLSARAYGISFDKLILRMAELALSAYQSRSLSEQCRIPLYQIPY